MFIAREDSHPPAPCEGAEVKLSGTIQFRSAPSHGVGDLNAPAIYKHVTANGVKPSRLLQRTLEMTQDQIKAAQEFVHTTIEALKTEKGVHAETAIAATARMAGTFLFHSFGFRFADAKAGQAVLSDKANEAGPHLVHVLGGLLEEMAIKLDSNRLGESASSEHQPLLGFLETQRQLEPRYTVIRDRYGLSLKEAAESAAAASALLIQKTSQVLDPNIAFQLAVFGFIEGTKTVPHSIVAE